MESEEFSAEIQPKPLTITAESAEKVYDGEPLVKDGYTAGKLVSGDKIIEVKVSGTQTNAGNAENVPHNAKNAETVQIRRKLRNQLCKWYAESYSAGYCRRAD